MAAVLDTKVQFVKGIGPARARQLARLDIATVRDLLFHVPRRWLDRSASPPIGDLKPGQEVTVFARVLAAGGRRMRNFRQMSSCVLADDSGAIEAFWFNRPDLKDLLRPGTELMVSGKVTAWRGRPRFTNPQFETVEPGGEASGVHAVVPVYPLTEGLSTWALRRAVRDALDRFGRELPETLTRETLDHYGFPGVRDALEAVHFPKSVKDALRARERLAYDELLYLELVLALRHRRHAELHRGRPLPGTGRLTGRFRELTGFEFTRAQERVITEIAADMASERGMNRLLQGDVGSGKTVVALYAMLVAVESGCQAALMAPTEILARQHFGGWHDRLRELGVETRLLTGSTRPTARAETLAGLESGQVQLVFGTHALIEAGVRFDQLGLVVVDEQHRFGVMQRAALMNKGENPDFLVMTATPIPRTLTLTVYGDLDVSVLDEKPPGRKEVVTRLVPESRRDRVYGYIEERLGRGEAVFFVCPLIEQSEKLDVASAVETSERVAATFPRRRVGLVHGRMRAEERDAAMDSLRRGELDILVSTTVIEVGVDIPRATVMVVEQPERFGLAQLHQLRGRIGRGDRRAVCVLMMPREPEGETGERLQFFGRTTDGFLLAEKDIELRGPGELLGTRQHGLPDLRVADIVRDGELLRRARRDAFRLVELDPGLVLPGHRRVRATLDERYHGREELLKVG
ncbi:ATP-dependent DNA helicase RecG [candidate division WOR-3 bacterium]|nr:ATP-dependent DNA helicase RecG [candidate division WOR-3 bacterium]